MNQIFISHAQHGEDVMLYRAFKTVANGFYVDVGAHDPEHLSVTKAFYDRGWRGVNIEPDRAHLASLALARPRDLNIGCLVGEREGILRFYEVAGTGLSTIDSELASQHKKKGYTVVEVEVAMRPLQAILDDLGVLQAHFLKVDVEGAEESVLRGINFQRFRPWVVVVEATAPLSTSRSDNEVREILENAGYVFGFFDGINDFYVASEHAELLQHFDRPANPLDGYISASEYHLMNRNRELEQSNAYPARGIRCFERYTRLLKAVVCGLKRWFLGRFSDFKVKRMRARLARQPLLDFIQPNDSSWREQSWEGLAMPERANAPTRRLDSSLCTRAQLESPAFRYWLEKLGTEFRLTRKNWEFAFILQALYERDVFRSGARGLGFAVGEEALPALFAALGCNIVATDLDPSDDRATVWAETAQLATSLEKLRRSEICSDKEFAQRVSYRHVDMNCIPEDLNGFDFTWSSCSFEHCGSIELGIQFIINQMACLKPGGIAVHTTEFNLTSDDETIQEGTTVIFRRRDIERLVASLRSCGHYVETIDYNIGRTAADQAVDIFPYTAVPHLKLLLFDKYISTSIALIVQKAI